MTFRFDKTQDLMNRAQVTDFRCQRNLMIDIERSWGIAGTFVHGGTHPDPIPSRATIFEQLHKHQEPSESRLQ